MLCIPLSNLKIYLSPLFLRSVMYLYVVALYHAGIKKRINIHVLFTVCVPVNENSFLVLCCGIKMHVCCCKVFAIVLLCVCDNEF